MAGEWIGDGLEGMIEAFRQWYCIPAQVVSIDGKRYVFVATKSNKDEEGVKFFFAKKWQGTKGLLC
jgi:hypothetical protein